MVNIKSTARIRDNPLVAEIMPMSSDERPLNVKFSLVNYRVGSLIVSNDLFLATPDGVLTD